MPSHRKTKQKKKRRPNDPSHGPPETSQPLDTRGDPPFAMTATPEKSPEQNRPFSERPLLEKQHRPTQRKIRGNGKQIPAPEKPPISLEWFRETSHTFPDLPQFEYCNRHLKLRNQPPLGKSVHHLGYNCSPDASSPNNTPTQKFIPELDSDRDHYLEYAEGDLRCYDVNLSQLPPTNAQYLQNGILISNEFIDSYESITMQL